MNTPAANTAAPQAEVRAKLTKKLPTFRIGFAKQMDMLRAYASLSEGGTKPVHYTRVAEIISVHEANVSSANPFFLEIGLITKAANGYLPSAAVLEYNRAFSWDKETAIVKLQPAIMPTWFASELRQRLQFRPLSEDAAIQVLAEASKAGPEAKPQLRTLLELCDATQIISRANGQLTLFPVSTESTPVPQPNYGQERFQRIAEELVNSPEPVVLQQPSPRPAATSAASDHQREGAITFDIRLNVSMAEIQGWTPERITAFFAGIAQVLAAKNQGGG